MAVVPVYRSPPPVTAVVAAYAPDRIPVITKLSAKALK
jgi:hypothetical protein